MLVVCMILVWTTYHSLQVYLSLFPQASIIERIWVIIGLIAIDASVVLFTVNKAQMAAALYALMIFILNLFVFWKGLLVPDELFSAENLIFLPGFLYAAAISFSLYTFTDLFVKYDEERMLQITADEAGEDWRKRALTAEKQVRELEKAEPIPDHVQKIMDITGELMEKIDWEKVDKSTLLENLRKNTEYNRRKMEGMGPVLPSR